MHGIANKILHVLLTLACCSPAPLGESVIGYQAVCHFQLADFNRCVKAVNRGDQTKNTSLFNSVLHEKMKIRREYSIHRWKIESGVYLVIANDGSVLEELQRN